jgi:hypothetical protein
MPPPMMISVRPLVEQVVDDAILSLSFAPPSGAKGRFGAPGAALISSSSG